MGLTNKSVGHGAIDAGIKITKRNKNERIIAVAGNPNVGKSTIFNALTGMNQHTGNWSGKTVSNALGYMKTAKYSYTLVDIPGTYSLIANSAEEEVARNYICFGNQDATLVVCDATCLERNLNLVLQIIEVSPRTIVCVNLLDEAKRKGIHIDLDKLSKKLGVPVVGTVGQNKKTLNALKTALDDIMRSDKQNPIKIVYPEYIENAIKTIEEAVISQLDLKINIRWLSLKLIDYDDSLINEINLFYGKNILADEIIVSAMSKARKTIEANGIPCDSVKDIITSEIFKTAESISKTAVKTDASQKMNFDRRIDKILTNKRLGYPIMLLLLAFMFWITIFAANYPSTLLSVFFNKLGVYISNFLTVIKTPPWLYSMIIDGIYRVLTWVVAVMLPPMAIFFPLFTLLEDVGYLPRIAYNLDKPFKCCKACGKQALTMCMGFGCNASGVVGCRIIDSPRERLIAILTNSLVPCNGRFPVLITLITMFFVASGMGYFSSLFSTLILTAVVLLGILMTFLCSKILSSTVLRGVPSSFTLELPPYRKPQIGKIIVRSIFDRTLFVLGRAVAVAAPAGLIIWIFANVKVGDASVFTRCSEFLDPFAKLIGLDGVILMAFILGFPANEIVLPLIIMAYLSNGTLTELSSVSETKVLFVQNGWSIVTGICMIIFTLFHWPCSTTVLTVKKETGSLGWTAVTILLPTLIGILLCFIVATIARII